MKSADILTLVNNYLDNIPYTRKPETLYEPIRYVLSLGGKRIRPVLMLMSYNLYKDDADTILPTACGLETYHNYTLLHDDLMDNADMRRGHATVHKKWDANTAILSGDSMLVLSYQRIAQCAPQYLPQILDLFTTTALEIGEGQQYDMEFETRDDVCEAEYIEMIRLKTSVLLACAMKMGAIQAGASPADQDALYRYGESLGLAFQLQDDYLDVYGDPSVFGKNIGGDITSNKKTFMLINALLRAEGQDKAELEAWIARKDFDRQEKVDAVTRLYTKLGIDRLARERIEYYTREALSCLDAVDTPDERKAELREYTMMMMRREKQPPLTAPNILHNMIDTHTHLDGEEFSIDRAATMQRAREAGVTRCLLPAIDLDSSRHILQICRETPTFCYPMLGLHPEEVNAGWQEQAESIMRLCAEAEQQGQRVIAIGEVGLDYYWTREYEREQLAAFERHVEWSVESGLPLMIHCRKAQNEMVSLLRRYERDLPGGVFHCFTGNEHEAAELLRFDRFALGIGGVLTFKKSLLPTTLPAVVPLDRIVLETDSPYMAPVPHRGKRNEPAFVANVLDRLAEAYGVDRATADDITTATAMRIFFPGEG